MSIIISDQTIEKEYRIEKQYLNFPDEMKQERQMVKFVAHEDTLTFSVLRITDNEPDYWIFKDVSTFNKR